jgi:hypothetical protein
MIPGLCWRGTAAAYRMAAVVPPLPHAFDRVRPSSGLFNSLCGDDCPLRPGISVLVWSGIDTVPWLSWSLPSHRAAENLDSAFQGATLRSGKLIVPWGIQALERHEISSETVTDCHGVKSPVAEDILLPKAAKTDGFPMPPFRICRSLQPEGNPAVSGPFPILDSKITCKNP